MYEVGFQLAYDLMNRRIVTAFKWLLDLITETGKFLIRLSRNFVMNKFFVLLLVCFFSGSALAKESDNYRLQQARIYMSDFYSSLLLRYHDIRPPAHEGVKDSYMDPLQELNGFYDRGHLTVGLKYLAQVNSTVDELRSQTKIDSLQDDEVFSSPYLLIDIYNARKSFENELSDEVSSVDHNVPSVSDVLMKLRVDVSEMMVLYSVSTYYGLKHLNASDPGLTAVDESIQKGLQWLEKNNSEIDADVSRIKVTYDFVRSRVVGLPRPWNPGAVITFLSRVDDRLKDAQESL